MGKLPVFWRPKRLSRWWRISAPTATMSVSPRPETRSSRQHLRWSCRRRGLSGRSEGLNARHERRPSRTGRRNEDELMCRARPATVTAYAEERWKESPAAPRFPPPTPVQPQPQPPTCDAARCPLTALARHGMTHRAPRRPGCLPCTILKGLPIAGFCERHTRHQCHQVACRGAPAGRSDRALMAWRRRGGDVGGDSASGGASAAYG